MIEFRWISLILMLQFAAVTEQHLTSVTVREGDEATLSCANEADQVKCNRTSWAFHHSSTRAAADLVKLGQIVKNQISGAELDGVSVSVNCSLMIQSVTADNVGRYFCMLLNYSGQEPVQNTLDLSLVKITEQKMSDRVVLKCSVSTHQTCSHNVKWLLQGQDIDEHNTDLVLRKLRCSTSITFLRSHFIYQSKNYQSLKCEVTDNDSRAQQFNVRSRASGKGKGTSGSDDAASQPSSGLWWLYIIVAAGLAALLAAVVLLIRWRKNKGKKTRTDEKLTDPDDGVSYSTIIHTKRTSDEAEVRPCDQAVTYSTVRAGACTDPSSLYATIN
ncbi:uncharacterized protein PAE49_002333 isoform 2-T2 [Odontesthes bonariensis]|uniref:uncharacterized protein LOC142375035 n=1 Tax=Odontesthes bonariensis TaxID=219752 RepID=UPI003F583F82